MEGSPSPPPFIFSDDYICQWDSCLKTFDDAERLYTHLKDEHVGRKAHHNLCLTCRWDKCTVPTFAKRDHITSHLRIHVASKPHCCELCKKRFKRPQDLKKHEKTHQGSDGAIVPNAATASKPTSSSSGHLKPGGNPALPLTPPTALDRSPSIASATTGSTLSPYSLPLSPADTAESWNPGLSSPSYSTNSDLFSSPNAPDLELDMMNSCFDRSSIDVSGTYYGAFPSSNIYDDMVSPQSAKRSRDGFDEVLSETLGAFAVESKKKKTDAAYNEDIMGPLNALSALMEVNPLTSDRLLSSLPNVTDWNQFNQLNHFCSTLFEDVSGEAFEPQSYDTPLFPEYEQKPSTLALDAEFAGTIDLDSNMSAFSTAQVDSIYSTIIPDDSFVSSSTLAWNTSLSQPGPAVRHSQPVKHSMQQPNRFIHPQYVSLPALQQGAAPIKNESVEEIIKPTVVLQEKRTYVEVSIQTAEKMAADELRMLKQRPTVIRRKSRQLIDTDALLESVPEAPDTPMPDINVEETVAALEADIPETQEQDQSSSRSNEQSPGVTISSAPTSAPETNSSKYESYLQRAKARQAAVAAASAAATAAAMEPVDPVEAMSRQLAQTHIDGTDFKPILKPSTTKPIIEGDVERQIKAAKARSLCSQDPIRKQHAEVVLNLLRSIDTIMADHRKAAQAKSVANPRTGGGVHVQNQGQIRTVSSYLPRRGTSSTTFHRPSPLHHEQSADSPDYSKLRSSLAEGSSYSSPAVLTSSTAQSSDHTPSLKHGSEVSTDSPVLYPTSDLHHPSAVPFELSEEERRFIEEDNAKTAAAQAAAAGYRTARV